MALEKSVKFISHEDYFSQASPEARMRFEAIQHCVSALFPQAEPCISYNMPAFKNEGKVFFFFAAFKKHIGIYPPVHHPDKLVQELQTYRNEKGNLAFPLKEPLPIDLIARVAQALHIQYYGK